MYLLNPSFFSPARLADKRPPRPASCQSPPPKAVPALGIHPASGTTSLLYGKCCSMGHNASSILDYRGQFHVRQPKTNAIRSTPKMQVASSDLSPQRCSGYVFDPALTICIALLASTESKGLTRSNCIFGVERASNNTEPLIMEKSLLILRVKGEMELVPSAVGPDEKEQRCKTPRGTHVGGMESRGGERASGSGD